MDKVMTSTQILLGRVDFSSTQRTEFTWLSKRELALGSESVVCGGKGET